MVPAVRHQLNELYVLFAQHTWDYLHTEHTCSVGGWDPCKDGSKRYRSCSRETLAGRFMMRGDPAVRCASRPRTSAVISDLTQCQVALLHSKLFDTDRCLRPLKSGSAAGRHGGTLPRNASSPGSQEDMSRV